MMWVGFVVSFLIGFFISAALACAKNADEQATEAYRSSLKKEGGCAGSLNEKQLEEFLWQKNTLDR